MHAIITARFRRAWRCASSIPLQVGIIHPEQLPERATGLLPNLPGSLARSAIDALLELRLPE